MKKYTFSPQKSKQKKRAAKLHVLKVFVNQTTRRTSKNRRR